MSFSLISVNQQETFRFNNGGWHEVLRLGQACGWEPAGTVLEPDEFNNWRDDWKGGYNSNDYQEVTAADALKLASAIEKATQSPLMKPDWAEYLRQFVAFARASDGFRLG